MKKNAGILVWQLIVLSIELLAIGLIVGLGFSGNAYENGQIDAMNGEWKYEMVVKQDTTYKEI